MIQGQDFVFTGLQSWDMTIGSNARDIALQVAQNNRVLYINAPRSLFSKSNLNIPQNVQRHQKNNRVKPAIRRINDNLWVLDYPFAILPMNFLPDGKFFDFVNRINNRRMYCFVKKTLKTLQFKDYILFIDNDMFRSFYAKEYLAPSLTLYYRRDQLTTGYWKNHAPRIEPLLSAKCDCVVANSEYLATMMKPYNLCAFNIGQGVDLSNYDADRVYEMPQDMKIIARPIVGYAGALTSQRLDLELIYSLAQSMSNISFVFVGGEDAKFASHKIHSLGNVYFLGFKNFPLIPQYIAAFDVCINPQLLNEVTIGNYPRKVDEYLALGKPIVATKTETMAIFEHYTWNCQGVDQYKNAIQQALLTTKDKDQKQERVAFAHTHTWQESVSKLYCIINSIKK
ncbi:MAG: glycosyltransferase [Odoribacter sp.]